MNKYVIELRPDCKVVQEICESDGQVRIGAKSIEYFEELNADYINENYGQLQDDAYQKGFEDGKKEAESGEAIELAKADAFNKGMLFKEEKIHDAFLRGVEKGKAVHDKGCEGCEHEGENKMTIPCILCCNSYKNRWEAKSDEIKVGDVVRLCRHKVPYIVTSCDVDDDTYILMTVNGGFIKAEKYNVRKTGRHFDIASILEDMKA